MTDQLKIPDVLLQQSLINEINIGIIICNMEDIIEWVNPYFCELLSVSHDKLIGTPIADLMDMDPLLPPNTNFRIKVKTHENKELWLACVQKRNKDKTQNDKIVRYFTDISDLQRRKPLRQMVSAGYDTSRLDPHTGTLNRRAIIQELNTQISRTRRYNNPLSAILLQFQLHTDMQNDEQKEYILTMVNAINAKLRWVDVIGSLSAGIFLIILPESSGTAAAQAWKKIDNDIRKLALEKGQTENAYQVNYSAWEQDNSADEMIQRLETFSGQKVA
jgi:GGDEF domain-containing protein